MRERYLWQQAIEYILELLWKIDRLETENARLLSIIERLYESK